MLSEASGGSLRPPEQGVLVSDALVEGDPVEDLCIIDSGVEFGGRVERRVRPALPSTPTSRASSAPSYTTHLTPTSAPASARPSCPRSSSGDPHLRTAAHLWGATRPSASTRA